MRFSVICVLGLAWLTAGCSPQAATTQPRRTVPLKVRTAGLISSRAVAPGERIEAELIEAVALNGEMRVQAGATAVLRVVDSNPGAINGRSALMLLKVTQLRPSLSHNIEISTAGLKQEVTEIAAGSILTFQLPAPDTAGRSGIH